MPAVPKGLILESSLHGTAKVAAEKPQLCLQRVRRGRGGFLSSDWKTKNLSTVKKESDIRWDTGSCQHFSLHGIEAFALTDAQLDLHSVVSVVLKEEPIVDDKLGIGSCAIEDVDLQEEQIISINTAIITCLDGMQ